MQGLLGVVVRAVAAGVTIALLERLYRRRRV
jgi:hypothetical protein